MAETMPKIRRYLKVERQYGGNSLAVENEAGEVLVFGDITLPRTHESGGPVTESPKAAEARAKARAEEDDKFTATVLRHLNDGLAMESGRKRLEREARSDKR